MAAALKEFEKGNKVKNDLKVLWEEVNQRLGSLQGWSA